MYVRAGPLFFKNFFQILFQTFPLNIKKKERMEIKGQISRPLNTFNGLSGLFLFLCWLKTCRALGDTVTKCMRCTALKIVL